MVSAQSLRTHIQGRASDAWQSLKFWLKQEEFAEAACFAGEAFEEFAETDGARSLEE